MLRKMKGLLEDMLLSLAATIHDGDEVRMDAWREFTAACLNLVPWNRPYGKSLFEAVCNKSVGLPFEGVMLRWKRPEGWLRWVLFWRKELQVFMCRRGPKEAYPNQLHAPGTFTRPGEIHDTNDFSPVFNRLSRKEFGSVLRTWELVDIRAGDEERGTDASLIFLVTGGDPAQLGLGAWYAVDRLPSDTVTIHRTEVIRRAADEFRFRSRLWVRFGNWVLNMVGAKLARKEEFK